MDYTPKELGKAGKLTKTKGVTMEDWVNSTFKVPEKYRVSSKIPNVVEQ